MQEDDGNEKGRAEEVTRSQSSHMNGLRPVFFWRVMPLLLLEAFGALVLLVFIVWWTMFSGRKNGELKNPTEEDKTTPSDKSE